MDIKSKDMKHFWMICLGGLLGLLHDSTIESMANKLVKAAIDRGARDNVTAIVVEILKNC